MPMYEYQCGRCDQSFTLLQKVNVRPGETICPHCGDNKIQRLFSSFSSASSKSTEAPAPSGGAGLHGCGSGGCGCA